MPADAPAEARAVARGRARRRAVGITPPTLAVVLQSSMLRSLTRDALSPTLAEWTGREIFMAKGQKRSGREPKKPKASKTTTAQPQSSFIQNAPKKPLPAKDRDK
jgi:hypothetical protein